MCFDICIKIPCFRLSCQFPFSCADLIHEYLSTESQKGSVQHLRNVTQQTFKGTPSVKSNTVRRVHLDV